MTLFDFGAIAILLVSGFIGFLRGGARELITVLAFVLAVVIAVLGLRIAGPIARHAVHPALLANALAMLVVFAVAYILLRIAGSILTRRIHQTQTLSVIDRAFGVGFGLVRALVLLGVFYMLFNAATPADRMPQWIKGGTFYPLSAGAGHMLMALAPQGSAVANKVGPALENAVREGSTDKPPASDRGSGYDETSRKTVDDLVEKTR